MEKYSLWLRKKPRKLGEFFLLLCGHPVVAVERYDVGLQPRQIGEMVSNSFGQIVHTLASLPPPV